MGASPRRSMASFLPLSLAVSNRPGPPDARSLGLPGQLRASARVRTKARLSCLDPPDDDGGWGIGAPVVILPHVARVVDPGGLDEVEHLRDSHGLRTHRRRPAGLDLTSTGLGYSNSPPVGGLP
jgi:hypothetical protein